MEVDKCYPLLRVIFLKIESSTDLMRSMCELSCVPACYVPAPKGRGAWQPTARARQYQQRRYGVVVREKDTNTQIPLKAKLLFSHGNSVNKQ